MNRPLTREQLGIILQGILGLALFLVLLQLWLLTAAVNAALGNDDTVAWPAALASLACCAVSVALFRALRRLEAT